MRTDKQIAASRLNSTKSRGRFHDLLPGLHVELQPQTAIEHMLVPTMAAAQRRKMRIWSPKKATVGTARREHKPAITWVPASATHTNAFFNMRYDRQFHRALNRFHEDRAFRLRSKTRLEPTNDAKQTT